MNILSNPLNWHDVSASPPSLKWDGNKFSLHNLSGGVLPFVIYQTSPSGPGDRVVGSVTAGSVNSVVTLYLVYASAISGAIYGSVPIPPGTNVSFDFAAAATGVLLLASSVAATASVVAGQYVEVTTSPAGAYNFDCVCGFETDTLSQMRNKVAIEMGYASQLNNYQLGFVLQLDQQLNFQQRRVVEDLTDISAERYFSWAMLAGQSNYCTDSNLETCRNKLRLARIFEAYIVATAGGVITRLEKGISFEYLRNGNQPHGKPTHYQVGSSIAVWPAPDVSNAYTLVVRGQLAATDMVAVGDKPSAPSDLIVMRTVAFLKSRKGHPDASDWMSQYRQSLAILNSDTFIDTRHIPSSGTFRRREDDSLTHAMEPRVYLP